MSQQINIQEVLRLFFRQHDFVSIRFSRNKIENIEKIGHLTRNKSCVVKKQSLMDIFLIQRVEQVAQLRASNATSHWPNQISEFFSRIAIKN